MHRVIAIFLATTCMVYSRKVNPYPLSIPIDYYPQKYEYVYNNRPYSDNIVYSTSFTRTDENFQPDKNVLEPTILHENDQLSSPSPNPHESKESSEEPEITSPSSPSLPSKEVQKNKYSNTDFSSDTSLGHDDKPKFLSNITSPLNTYQERPEYQEVNEYPSNNRSPPSKSYQERPQERPKYQGNNKYPSNNGSPPSKSYQKRPKYQEDNEYSSNNGPPPSKSYQKRPQEQPTYVLNYKHSNDISSPSKSYQERPKYSNYNTFPSNNPPSKTYQKRPKNSKEYKNPYYISIPSKSYQERPKYEKDYKVPPNNVYPVQTTYQQQHKYKNLYESPLNNGLPSQKTHTERPKYPKNYKNREYFLPSESSSEEQSKYLSYYNESKSYLELPNHLEIKKIVSPSKEYEDSDDDEYHDISPPPPEYLAPQYPNIDYSGSWHAPSFYQSLKDFEETENIVQSRIFGKGSKQNEKQYAIIAGVLDGMIKTMANTPWRFYDQAYDVNMPKLFKYARATRHVANAQVKCIYEWINQGIEKMRAIINNSWINYICSVSDVPCDTLVVAVVDTSNDVDLQKEARLLLAIVTMLRVTLLLVCACAVYAHRPYTSSHSKSPFGDEWELPRETNENLEWGDLSLTPRLPPFDSNIELRNPPEPWVAPPYYKSLQDFDEGLARVKSHFTQEAFDDKDNYNFRYIMLVSVVDFLSWQVANNGWEPYNRYYETLVKRHVRNIYKDPKPAIMNLKCTVFEPAQNVINKVRKVIKNPAVQYVCMSQPSFCDAVIWSTIANSPSVELKQAADVLLAAGKAATTFLKSFADTFDAVSKQNVYRFMDWAKEDLRPLVDVDAKARKIIDMYGKYTCLDQQPSINHDDHDGRGSSSVLSQG